LPAREHDPRDGVAPQLSASPAVPAGDREPAEVGFAVIGCGYWGEKYLRVLRELAGSRIIVACDRDPARLSTLRRTLTGVETTVDVEAALCHPGVDAVVICTEAASHHPIARSSLLAGKHVLVEKPLATSSRHADALLALATTANRVLMVGHTFLYNGGVRKLKDYIAQAEVGRIYYLHARRTNLGPVRDDVNVVWDLAPHDVSIFNYLLDASPEWAIAVGARALDTPRDDVAFVTLGYPDGVLGHIHVSWVEPEKTRQVVVVGSQKRLVFDDTNLKERVRVFNAGIAPAPRPSASGNGRLVVEDGVNIPLVEASEPLKTQCAHFLEAISSAAEPLTGGAAAREVVRVMEAIDRSLRLRGARVELG
jgi:predicted dehydrogenase